MLTRKQSDTVLNEVLISVDAPEHIRDIIPTINVCGLCGNTGKLKLPVRHTPYGLKIAAETRFCLCPNGREFQREAGKKKTPP